MPITITGDSLHVDLDKIRAIGHAGIQRTSAFSGFSFNAAHLEPTPPFHPSECYVRIVPEELPTEQKLEYISNYKFWIACNAIRELVESFGQFLNVFFYAMILLKYRDSKSLQEVADEAKKFEQLGEKKKLKLLKRAIEIEIPCRTEIESLIRTRNTITHRWGIPKSSALTVLWKKPQIFARSQDGIETILQPPIDEPFSFKAGARIGVRTVQTSVKFEVGEQITFKSDQIHEMCLMMNNVIDSLVKQAKDHAAKFGVRVIDRPS